MNRDMEELFREYRHELLDAENARFLSGTIIRTVMHSTSPLSEEARLNEVWLRMREQILALNDPVVWQAVFRILNGYANPKMAFEIANLNYRHIKDIVCLLTAGIVAGHERLDASVRKYRPTLIRQAALAAVESLQAKAASYDEIAPRLISVFGSLEKPGTLGPALASLPEEMLAGREVFVDMLRLFGNALETGEIS